MRQRMLSMGWDKFSKEEVSPDFVMHGNDGKPCDMRCMEELNKSATLVEWPMEQIKIQQVDNAVTITGITHHSGVDKKTIKNGQITNILPKLTPPKWQMDMVDSAIHRYLSIYARIK